MRSRKSKRLSIGVLVVLAVCVLWGGHASAYETFLIRGSITTSTPLADVYLGVYYDLPDPQNNPLYNYMFTPLTGEISANSRFEFETFIGDNFDMNSADFNNIDQYVIMARNAAGLVTLTIPWNATGRAWESIFTNNDDVGESTIAGYLASGNTNGLANFMSLYAGYSVPNQGSDWYFPWVADNSNCNLYSFSLALQAGQVEFSAQVVPIPPAVWLLGSGLLGLVALRRRFKK